MRKEVQFIIHEANLTLLETFFIIRNYCSDDHELTEWLMPFSNTLQLKLLHHSTTQGNHTLSVHKVMLNK